MPSPTTEVSALGHFRSTHGLCLQSQCKKHRNKVREIQQRRQKTSLLHKMVKMWIWKKTKTPLKEMWK